MTRLFWTYVPCVFLKFPVGAFTHVNQLLIVDNNFP